MSKKWNPTVYVCGTCGQKLYSKYPRHWCSCECGNYIDETEYYCRMGGKFDNFKRLGKLLDLEKEEK